LTWGKEGDKLGPCQDKRDRTEVGIHGGVGGAVSGDGEGIGEPHGETGGDDGAGWIGQVISIYPYVPQVYKTFTHNYITHWRVRFLSIPKVVIKDMQTENPQQANPADAG
jgi:hypothetical protein